MENQSENPKTFAETKQPLLVNSAGAEITSELLLNDENILNELAAYYAWDNFEDEIVEATRESDFLHYLADSHSQYIDDNTLNKFTESYQGFYNSRADFAEELFIDAYGVSELPAIIKYNIDWHEVAEEIRKDGSYTFLPDKDYSKNVYVFCNE